MSTKRSLSPKRALVAAIAAALLALPLHALFSEAPAETRAWYASGLEALGFSVFPRPVDVPDFTVQALGGKAAKLSDQRGKIVILNFWATWCPPCRAEMPAIEGLWKKNKDKAFTVMGLSVGEKAGAVADFIRKEGYSYPIYLDPSGDIGGQFGARSIPTTYVLDKSGKAIAGKVGGAAYDSPKAVALFAELAAR